MTFTTHQQLEKQATGQASWDDGLNENFDILERGLHWVGTAGTSIASGQVVLVNSAGFTVPVDGRSLDNFPLGVSYKNVNSGESAQFVSNGIMPNSLYSLIPGLPVFVSPASLGWPVNSFAGHGPPVGWAISQRVLRVNPGQPRVIPELTTEVTTVIASKTTPGAFDMKLANRGIARRVEILTDSGDAWKVQFHSGSRRVSSEALFETLTKSSNLGSTDINSIYFKDQAGFPWYNTDTASPALVFGRITVQSGSAVNTIVAAVTVQVERFR